MEHPGAVSAQRLRLTSIGWERIQLSLVLEADDGTDLPDGGSLRFRRDGSGRQEMAPTHVSTDRSAGRLAVRFNVMSGYRQLPLEPGRWALVQASGEALPIVADPPQVAAAEHAFTFPNAPYLVRPGLGVPDGTALIVEITRPDAAAAGRSRTKRLWRSLVPAPVRRARVRAIRRIRRIPREALVAVLRRTVRRTGRRIVFASAGTTGLQGNLAVVRDRMVERGVDRAFELVTLPGRRKIAGGSARRALGTIRAEIREIRLLTSADIVLVAGSLQRAVYRLDFDPDVRFIQLWHASGALKLVGYSRIGMTDGPDPSSRVHRRYTNAIVSSEYDVPFYAEAFGLPEERIVPTGIPRMDRFFDEASLTAAREAALAAVPMADGRRTILFAPTYRGLARTATYDYGQLDFAALHAVATEQDALVICKMHPFVREPVPIPEAFRDRIIDGTRIKVDVNDLLCIVDLLITDYSSILFEYSVLGRPMLFFAYDLDDYESERDFYVPYAEFVPGRIVRTCADLVDAIRRDEVEFEKVHAFAARHFAHLDAGSADRVIDLALAR